MTTTRIRGFASREEWLAARGIGASEVAAIRGRSPFRTAWAVWVARQPDPPGLDRVQQTPRQVEGHALEPGILADYNATESRRTGTNVAARLTQRVVVEHAEFPWATASPDAVHLSLEAVHARLDASSRGNPIPPLAISDLAGGVELKSDMHGWSWHRDDRVVLESYSPEADDTYAPAGYLDQVYWTLEVTGCPWWDLAAWLAPRYGEFRPRLKIVRVMADRDHQRRLLLDVALWRQRHLVDGITGVEKAVTQSDEGTLSRLELVEAVAEQTERLAAALSRKSDELAASVSRLADRVRKLEGAVDRGAGALDGHALAVRDLAERVRKLEETHGLEADAIRARLDAIDESVSALERQRPIDAVCTACARVNGWMARRRPLIGGPVPCTVCGTLTGFGAHR